MAKPNDKEDMLLARIANAKAKLAKLKAKRIQTCGKLVVDAGLDQFSRETLKKAFSDLAKQLVCE